MRLFDTDCFLYEHVLCVLLLVCVLMCLCECGAWIAPEERTSKTFLFFYYEDENSQLTIKDAHLFSAIRNNTMSKMEKIFFTIFFHKSFIKLVQLCIVTLNLSFFLYM